MRKRSPLKRPQFRMSHRVTISAATRNAIRHRSRLVERSKRIWIQVSNPEPESTLPAKLVDLGDEGDPDRGALARIARRQSERNGIPPGAAGAQSQLQMVGSD